MEGGFLKHMHILFGMVKETVTLKTVIMIIIFIPMASLTFSFTLFCNY